MTEKETTRTSKFLSLVLRHEPERVGLVLGEAGWVGVDELLEAVNCHGLALTLDQLKHVVATSDKKRFAFSDDGQRIRASQGHSVEVDLQYAPQTPPEILYHGTFAVQIVKFYKTLPKIDEARVLGRQVLRSGTSVAANYRAFCRSKSQADFISKMGTVLEEADETLLWLELFEEAEVCVAEKVAKLKSEADVLLRTFSSALGTAKRDSR